MKITKTYLRQVIQEELSAVMSEADAGYYQIGPPGPEPSPNKDAMELSDIEGKLADFEKRKRFIARVDDLRGSPMMTYLRAPFEKWQDLMDAAEKGDGADLEAAMAEVERIAAKFERIG
jgi:hypothetical protein